MAPTLPPAIPSGWSPDLPMAVAHWTAAQPDVVMLDLSLPGLDGLQVLDAARSELPTDGIVGLRVNHALNVHVEKVSVTPLAAR